jgi:peptidoglycan/xylan/chitin deacetylase (PgdA/CDA1 family)
MFHRVLWSVIMGNILGIGTLSTAFAATSAPRPIPILVYHHVRDTRPYPKTTWSWKMSVSPAVFEKHMQWIVDNGYTTVTMDTLTDILSGKIVGPKKPVVITFDDNNVTQYDIALPILEKHRQIAVFYLVTSTLKMKNAVINADRALDLHRRGMDVQSHTVTHATLNAVSMKRLDSELIDSRKALEALLGKKVQHIAYPSTAHNSTVRAHAVSAGYITGVIMDPRAATMSDDLRKLPRIMMTDDTKLSKVLP